MSFRRIGFRRIFLVSLVIILIIIGVLVFIKVFPIKLIQHKQTQTNPSSPNTLTGDGKTYTVKTVIDGDTIILADGIHVRYLGIDAPEIAHSQEVRGQESEVSDGGSGVGGECYGQEAKKINEDLVLGKKVRLEFEDNKYDRYGRTLAWVYLDPVSAGGPFKGDPFLNSEGMVNFRMIKQGASFYYWSPIPVDYTAELISAQEQARKERVGLWGKCGKINGECLIKGNLDRNDKRYYHLPGFKYYETTQINPEHGDRWFCSEEAAIKAGFKRAVD